MTRSIRTITALFGVAVLAGACGSAGSPTPAATTAAPAAASIDIQGFKFPANTDVAKGTNVAWTNKDGTAHTVTSGTRPNKDGKFDGQVAPGATFSFTFTDAGVYQYYCTIHGSMNATITVK
jgi:plastocyanin